ncbi:Long chain acyl-CoA synthetase 7, peroxisomal [Galdieria sulphuraria]|nr:Long chain acyl-CoA synthetase 7, peroxisomal [Galdieria sulphuraria]
MANGVEGHKYSIVKPGAEAKEGEGPPHVCSFDQPFCLQPFPSEKLNTFYDMLCRAERMYPDGNSLGRRMRNKNGELGKFEFMTYKELKKKVLSLGSSFLRLGLKFGDHIGIFSKNCPEWLIVHLAISSQGMVSVPVYESLGPDSVEFIVNHSDMRLLCISSENLNKVLENKEKFPKLEKLICKSSFQMETIQKNGTTGKPKGVMLPNKAFVCEVAGILRVIEHYNISLTNHDVTMSYLPLAHIFEQALEAVTICCGAQLGYYSGDIKNLTDDFKALKPTFLIGVPRVFSRIEEGVKKQVANSSFLKRSMFHFAYQRQLQRVKNGSRSWLMDKLVFSKLKAAVFPRLRFMVSGSAPLSASTHNFLKVCFMVPVLQGYGLTETTAGVTICGPDNPAGCVGGLLPVAEIKLKDIPEMNYTSKDPVAPKGEVCVKGPVVFVGYYKDEQATKEAFDEDGYFCTGDVGEYISPEYLEQHEESELVAVVHPNQQKSEQWAEENQKTRDFKELCKDKEFKKAVLEDLKKVAKSKSLKGYEAVKNIYLEPEAFSIENDLMTPTMKLKRPALSKKYQKEIEKMYQETHKS